MTRKRRNLKGDHIIVGRYKNVRDQSDRSYEEYRFSIDVRLRFTLEKQKRNGGGDVTFGSIERTPNQRTYFLISENGNCLGLMSLSYLRFLYLHSFQPGMSDQLFAQVS